MGKTLAGLAQRFGVHSAQINQDKSQFLERAPAAFDEARRIRQSM